MPRNNPAPEEQPVNMQFPVRGIDLSSGYNSQAPGTTPIGQNVRAFDAGTLRMRGGNRPGLTPFLGAGSTFQVSGTNLVQHVASIVWIDPAAIA